MCCLINPKRKNRMPKEPFEILQQYFGFPAFRGEQENIIRRLVDSPNGEDHCLVLMPTGGGKSLCYQVPALCLGGGTLVLSPLIALMQDQVDALRRKRIPATFINATVSAEDKETRLQHFLEGKFKMLYVTPERFRKPARFPPGLFPHRGIPRLDRQPLNHCPDRHGNPGSAGRYH
jgi:ATP-dependent DNA helicase RecQ